MAGGVARARSELEGNGRSNANKVMVVLADGQQSSGGGNPVQEARRAQSADVRVMTIGIPPLEDRSNLRQMATSPQGANFVEAESVEEINDAFDAIAQQICQ